MILSPGAEPKRPPLPGIDLDGVFTLRTVTDMERIDAYLKGRSASRAVVVGGGFIGVEMAENLQRRGLDVTIVELADQVVASCLYTQIPESRINTELFNHHQKTEYPYNHTENAF